jgi:hypothetical protein
MHDVGRCTSCPAATEPLVRFGHVRLGLLMAGLSVSLFHPFHQTEAVHGRRIMKASRNYASQCTFAGVPPAEAAKHASRAIGWPELSADAIWLTDKGT